MVEGKTSFEEILKIIDLENDLSSYKDFNLKTNLSLTDLKNNSKEKPEIETLDI